MSLTLGKGLGDLFTFIFLVYMARAYGMDILGKYAFAMSIGGMTSIFVTIGLNALMLREVSKDRSQNQKYVGNLILTEAVLAGLTWILIVTIASVSPLSADTKIIIVLIGTYHIFYKISMLFRAEFKAHEEMHFSALLESSHKVVILIFGMASIVLWKNPVITLSVYPISAMAMCFLGFALSVKRYGRPVLKPDYAFIKTAATRAVPFFLMMLMAQFYDRIGIILLTVFKGEAAAGVFAAADRFLVTVAVGISTFGSAILPTMSRLSGSSREGLLKLYERAIRLMLVAVLPVSTLLFIGRDPIILWV